MSNGRWVNVHIQEILSKDRIEKYYQYAIFLVSWHWNIFTFCCMKMESSSRSSLRPTTNTGRSTTLPHWPSAMSWTPQLNVGPMNCCHLAACSTVRPAMERTSSPCTARLASLSQVCSTPNMHLVEDLRFSLWTNLTFHLWGNSANFVLCLQGLAKIITIYFDGISLYHHT